jgi:hypothetical protein
MKDDVVIVLIGASLFVYFGEMACAAAPCLPRNVPEKLGAGWRGLPAHFPRMPFCTQFTFRSQQKSSGDVQVHIRD